MNEVDLLKNYVLDVANECMKKDGYKDEDEGYMLGCCQKMYKANRRLNQLIPFNTLQAEVEKKLTPEKNKYDTLEIDFLENAKKQSFYYDYQTTPSIFINGDLVRGVTDPELAVGAICDSMKDPLEGCQAIHKDQIDRLHKLYDDRLEENAENIVMMRMIVFVCMVVIFILGYLFFKKMIVSQMNKDIESYAQLGVAEYHRVREDTEGNTPNGGITGA